jgi:CBS domain-containing protein
VATVEPLASLRVASLLMRNAHVGTLVAIDEAGRPAGILTDRDIVVAVIAVPGARPEGIRACDVMQTGVVTIREDRGVLEALEKMEAQGVRRLVVVDAHGRLAGIVSSDDVLRALAAGLGRLAGALGRAASRETTERRPIDLA